MNPRHRQARAWLRWATLVTLAAALMVAAAAIDDAARMPRWLKW